ncbi:MAG TPA: pyridoxal 5'-phosphate synthase glutaminase subunit PdxT [Nitrososphaeraceae archaeon]|jgi:5'-phosphate synthase pdxT subunit
MKGVNIGVLAIQGDVEENIAATTKALTSMSLQGTVVPVRYSDDLEKINGIILPGGESTSIGHMLALNPEMSHILQEKLSNGMPTLGICAGMIVMAKKAYDMAVGEMNQYLLNVLDVVIERNSFGRQHESFETELEIEDIGANPFKGVFIRAPSVKSVGRDVQVLGRLGEKIIAVQQGNLIGTSFHPELSGDLRFHIRLIKQVSQ